MTGTLNGLLAVLVSRVYVARVTAFAVNKSLQDVSKKVDDIYNMYCNREKCGEWKKGVDGSYESHFEGNCGDLSTLHTATRTLHHSIDIYNKTDTL